MTTANPEQDVGRGHSVEGLVLDRLALMRPSQLAKVRNSLVRHAAEIAIVREWLAGRVEKLVKLE